MKSAASFFPAARRADHGALKSLAVHRSPKRGAIRFSLVVQSVPLSLWQAGQAPALTGLRNRNTRQDKRPAEKDAGGNRFIEEDRTGPNRENGNQVQECAGRGGR